MSKILILGGGISGLSAAWYAARRYHRDATITLFEKEERLGGWVQTRREGGFLFEEGPRTFPYERSAHLRALVQELGLDSEIILSSPFAQKRYLWHRGKMRSLRTLFFRFLPTLLRGRFRPNPEGDVSVYAFAASKFSADVAETLFDPMVSGIYGGDMRKLSMRACFPDWLNKKGSLPKGRLFTLRGGARRLIEELIRQLPIDIQTGVSVDALHSEGVVVNGRLCKADRVISALPAPELGRLSGEWRDFPMASLFRVFLAYPKAVLPYKGFGYLVPSQEGEEVLGMVWDSEIFPEQNLADETRITVMVRDTAQDPIQAALQALAKHLQIREKPIYAAASLAKEAIPQFEVGYLEKLEQWKASLRKKFPYLRIAGNFLRGASVEMCVRSAKEAAQ